MTMDKKREDDMCDKQPVVKSIDSIKLDTDFSYKHEYYFPSTLYHIATQIGGIIGVVAICFSAAWATTIYGYLLGFWCGIGVTIGMHRYYSHRSFKAKLPFELFLIFLATVAGQKDIYWWARDHRLHHKFSDTDADPYNASRGFWFSHIKWAMVKKHPLVVEKGKSIDMSDLEENKYVMFQRRNYFWLHVIFSVILPMLVPMYLWNETFWNSFLVAYALRNALVLNATWTVNSFAHLWGSKPVDTRISPAQSAISDFCSFGEGWHNYHHTFPYDCGMSEYGYTPGINTKLLFLAARFGWAYDLKRASQKAVMGHANRHGDGSLGILAS